MQKMWNAVHGIAANRVFRLETFCLQRLQSFIEQKNGSCFIYKSASHNNLNNSFTISHFCSLKQFSRDSLDYPHCHTVNLTDELCFCWPRSCFRVNLIPSKTSPTTPRSSWLPPRCTGELARGYFSGSQTIPWRWGDSLFPMTRLATGELRGRWMFSAEV